MEKVVLSVENGRYGVDMTRGIRLRHWRTL